MSFDKGVVQDSFGKAKPILLDVVTKFYEFLTTDYPQTLEFFQSSDIEAKKKETVLHLTDLVENFENEEKLTSEFIALNKVFSNSNISEEKFDWAINSFEKSLGYFFGDDWDEQLSDNWHKAFLFIKEEIFLDRSEATKIELPTENEKVIEVPEIKNNEDEEMKASIPSIKKNKNNKVDIPDLGSFTIESLDLPSELTERIQEAARQLVKKSIQSELEIALESELKKYLEQGIGDFLKKSS